MRIGLALLAMALAAITASGRARAGDCGGLLGLKLGGASITAAEIVPAGPAAPAHCRVRGIAAGSVGYEVWLPAAGWNGRLLSVGNGGFGGSIPLPALTEGLAEGYAVTGNDTGHQGEDRAWMADRARVRLWGHSATHLVTEPAKAIVRAYYGAPASHAYFAGCSTGGAQAMEEAEFFPGDYDGVVAGAPGMSYARLMLSFLWGLKITEEAGGPLSPEQLRLLAATVLEACDARDGVKDGLVSDPLACRFDPGALRCADDAKPGCLSDAQVELVRRMYQGPRNPRTGEQIYPGFAPGSEADLTSAGAGPFAYGWGGIQGPLAQMFAIPLLRDMVYRDPAWDWRRFDWDRDVADLDRRIGADITAVSPDLRAFARRGGRLIMYQGWGDPLNAQTLPANYRHQVIALFARRGAPASAERLVDGFFRLFMAPGMAHCLGGPGPSRFDALAAVQVWVERGQAPTSMVATGGSALPKDASRLLCPFPGTARWSGTGDPNDAHSFACVEPAR
jgi:feruloyl esterase